MANFTPIFLFTLNKEGGFQKDASDSANYVQGKLIGTNRGISAVGYYDYYKRVPTEADMRNLTQAQAQAIYKKNYWDKINGDKIKNQSVAELMFQYVIGSGAGQLSDIKAIVNGVAGKKVLAEVDRTFTDAEINIVNSLPSKQLWDALKAWRHAFFIRLVTKVPKNKKFLVGWQSRLNSYVYKPSEGETTAGGGAGITGAQLFFLALTIIAIAKRKDISNYLSNTKS